MKITRTIPRPPPEFVMTFSRDEGWDLLMALRDIYWKYEQAADRDKWKLWAKDLDGALRRDL